MNRKFALALFVLVGLTCITAFVFLASVAWYSFSRPANLSEAQKTEIFRGLYYQREVRDKPRPVVLHIVTIELRENGLSFLVTPGDPQAELPLKARTTSQFLNSFDLQMAINGDAFTPWSSNGPLDYYPHPGDPVAPNGYAASRGIEYAGDNAAAPTLYITKSNTARFNTPIGKLDNAISGERMLVDKGKSVVEIPSGEDTPQPRTAIGLDKSGKRLIMIVVDGRQSGFSEGVTLAELAEILIQFKAYQAMNLDGGGSSTLAIEGPDGAPTVLNSPIDSGIPGRERPVGNHLGIYAKPVKRK